MINFKGHTKIELTDVNTDKTEVYEDDNMVTNALDYFLQDTGMLWTPTIQTVASTPLKTLMGGLLLLDTALTESATNVIPAGGVKMVGNGSADIASDGADGVTELGSWNATESGWMSDGSYKMVWDFSTTQANGTIACACLTSKKNGYIGIGNNTSQAYRTSGDYNLISQNNTGYNVDPIANITSSRVFSVSVADSTLTYVDYYNLYYNSTYAAQHMGATGKLKLITKEIPITTFDIRQCNPYNNEGGQENITAVETEVTLPSAFVSAVNGHTPWLAGKFGDYYYILATTLNGITPNSTVQGVKINCSTKAVTGFTVTNTTANNLSVADYGVSFGNNTISFYSNGTGIVFQDLSDNSDTDVIDISVNYGGGGSDAASCCRYIREDSFVIGRAPAYRVDLTDRTLTPTSDILGARYGRIVALDNPLLMTASLADGGYWSHDNFNLNHTTDYLATINNLQEAVTKTASKTMKVTYILRFDVENE